MAAENTRSTSTLILDDLLAMMRAMANVLGPLPVPIIPSEFIEKGVAYRISASEFNDEFIVMHPDDVEEQGWNAYIKPRPPLA